MALELGIAHGLGRRYFILLNSKIDQSKDVSSDIKGIDRIQYQSNSELEAKLILLIKQELPQRAGRSDSAFKTIKSQIIEVLITTPGLGLSRLAVEVREDKTLVQSTARVMVQEGELVTQGQKKGTIYFIANTVLKKAPRRQARRPSGKGQNTSR